MKQLMDAKSNTHTRGFQAGKLKSHFTFAKPGPRANHSPENWEFKSENPFANRMVNDSKYREETRF